MRFRHMCLQQRWIQSKPDSVLFDRVRLPLLREGMQLNKLNTCCIKEVAMVVIAHKDRLMRFGFDLFAHLCRRHQCELIVMNTETLSPEQEMVQDLMTITHCFSARLSGLRNYRKALNRALKEPSE